MQLITSLLLTVNIQLGPPTNPLKIAIASTVHAHKLVCYTVMRIPIFSLFSSQHSELVLTVYCRL